MEKIEVRGQIKAAYKSGLPISVTTESGGISGVVVSFEPLAFGLENESGMCAVIGYDDVVDIRAIPARPERMASKMTIKEKARLGFERDREIEVYIKGVKHLVGYVSSYAPHLITIVGSGEEEKEYVPTQYDAITDIRFVGEPREEDSPKLEDYITACHKEIRELKVENAELKRSLFEPTTGKEEPHDIAKERWEWHVIEGFGDTLCLVDNLEQTHFVCTPAQKALQAAAPELADISRDVVEEYGYFKGTTSASTKIVELIWRLRDAGIPVAEWYKGGRNTPPYDKVYHEGTNA